MPILGFTVSDDEMRRLVRRKPRGSCPNCRADDWVQETLNVIVREYGGRRYMVDLMRCEDCCHSWKRAVVMED